MRYEIYIPAIFLSILMMMQPFAGISFWSDATNKPTILTTTEKRTMQILDMNVDFTQLKEETMWPNGTKKIHISIWTKSIPGVPFVRVNGTKIIQPKEYRTTQSNSLIPLAFATTINPIPPPNVPTPPIDWWKWWDSVIFLLAGVHGKYYVKYEQPDNYFSYYPEEWWTPWAFYVTKIHVHIPKNDTEAMIKGIISLSHYMESTFKYAAAALSISSGLIGFLGVVAAEGSLLSEWAPPVAAALAILAGICAILSQVWANEGYSEAEYVKDVVQTSNEDGFCWLTPCQGRDYTWAWDPFWTEPLTILQRCSERAWYISFGSERDSLTYLTSEWTVNWKILCGSTSACIR
jgi:hypothetical protein